MEPTVTVQTSSVSETEAFGAKLARRMLEDPSLPPFVALFGDLGVGKTAFVRGFASALSPTSAVRSPTFALVREYPARPRPIFHFDMYRVTDEDELISIGYYDYLARDGICLVEWSENIANDLPRDYLRILIEKDNADAPDSRRITVSRMGGDA